MFLYVSNQWASLAIDMERRETNLIHPLASADPPEIVRERFMPMMLQLTFVALLNMTSLSGVVHTTADWSYGVALTPQHPVQRNNTGACMLFYSLPRDNQFMVVSETTIENAQHAFVHALVKLCYRVTGRKVGDIKSRQTKRDAEGNTVGIRMRDGTGKFLRGKATAGHRTTPATAVAPLPTSLLMLEHHRRFVQQSDFTVLVPSQSWPVVSVPYVCHRLTVNQTI